MISSSGHVGDPGFERQADALIRRLEALSERVMSATGDPPSPLVAEMLEELSAAVEELEVSTEEIHGQNEALVEAKKQLDVESARYRELFDLAPDGYLVTDTVGVILESNRAASDLLGTPGHFLDQKPVVVFVDAADRRAVLDHLHDAVSGDHGPVIEFEAGFAPPNRDPFSASVHITVGGAAGAADPAGPSRALVAPRRQPPDSGRAGTRRQRDPLPPHRGERSRRRHRHRWRGVRHVRVTLHRVRALPRPCRGRGSVGCRPRPSRRPRRPRVAAGGRFARPA